MESSVRSLKEKDISGKTEKKGENIEALKGEYENLLRQFVFLNELVSLLFSSMSIDEVLNKIITGIHRMLNIDRVAIISINREENLLECIHATGLEKDQREALTIALDTCASIMVNAAVSKRPFFSYDEAALIRRLIYASLAEQETDSLIFPLFSYRGTGCLQNRNDDLVDSEHRNIRKHTSSGEAFSIGEECVSCKYFPAFGVIWMDNRYSGRKFNQELVTLYTLILNMNVAVENKILFEQLTEVSIKDGLTGAFNRKYLFSIIEKEVERASRQGTSLSATMIDLDNFKQINDTYGHQYGDRFLQAFSQFILKRIRKMDYFCRYGGDEFVIVFPGATPEQAAKVVNRLTEKMKSEEADLKGIRVSAGIASFPESTHNADEILEFADRALYAAKRKGKGMIEIFSDFHTD